ncbi:MAG: hypothetical protein ABJE95_27485 [Byssovorax sp.]
MRKLDLTPAFDLNRELYATEPDEKNAVTRALILFELLASSSNDTLPLPDDTIDFATGYTTVWAHALPDVKLVLTYIVTPEQIELWSLRRDLRPG